MGSRRRVWVASAKVDGDVGKVHLVAVTGMSGAGRSTALRMLEDLGCYCVDNMPPALIPELISMLSSEAELTRVAVGMDVRAGRFLEGAGEVLDGLEAAGHTVELIFLESADDELVRRFSETRRAHPLAPGGNVLAAIQRERERVAPLRARAKLIVDTTGMSVHDLRRMLVDHIARGERSPRMVTRVMSFGFKYGVPVDADLVFDLRYLPNPHFVPELRPKTGLDPAVAGFVFAADEAGELLDDLAALLTKLLPRYEREGKAYLTVAVGCTGGRHRSVAMAERLAAALADAGEIRVEHRDAALEPGA
ncbi:MAG: RNase adapter RapZ [Myxococcales bacterium]|nr:RNase adapter RapZ [Myxococcales bacterium]